MRAALTTLAACLLVACGGDQAEPFGLNVTVDGRGLSIEERGRISKLALRAAGVEQYATEIDVARLGDEDKLEMGLRYVPLVQKGALTLTIDARDTQNAAVAVGRADAVEIIAERSVPVRIMLKAGASRHVGDRCTSDGDLCDGDGGCVDGVCCRSVCSGACEACDVAGVEGVCVPLPAGDRPRPGHGLCEVEPGSTCGRDGACDGAGLCRKWTLGTACGSSTCTVSTNLFVPDGECDGAGTCITSPAIPCDPYRCKDASVCFTSCTDATQCTGSPPTCNTAVTPGSCGPKPNGATCTQDAECQSMHCVENDAMGNGVCCDTTCTATCMSCRIAATRGKCSLVPVGQDPRAQCPAAAGADAACKPGGCAGTTPQCRLSPMTTQCRAPACDAGTFIGSLATTCNADGTCPAAGTVSCDPFRCAATACKTTCTVNGDCQTGACRGGKCATFGGAYQTCGAACQNANPLEGTDACACAAGYSAQRMIAGYNECGGGGYTIVTFCDRAARTPQSDWGGMYVDYPAAFCGGRVDVTNAYTGMLACPADTVATTYRMYLADCPGAPNSMVPIVLCTSMTAPVVTFGGAFEKDDDVDAQPDCRVVNPKTGDCTCPAGTSPRALRVFVNRSPINPTIIGAHIFFCTP
jgi:hypothetical protein